MVDSPVDDLWETRSHGGKRSNEAAYRVSALLVVVCLYNNRNACSSQEHKTFWSCTKIANVFDLCGFGAVYFFSGVGRRWAFS
jgi:hypothetical protein